MSLLQMDLGPSAYDPTRSMYPSFLGEATGNKWDYQPVTTHDLFNKASEAISADFHTIPAPDTSASMIGSAPYK